MDDQRSYGGKPDFSSRLPNGGEGGPLHAAQLLGLGTVEPVTSFQQPAGGARRSALLNDGLSLSGRLSREWIAHFARHNQHGLLCGVVDHFECGQQVAPGSGDTEPVDLDRPDVRRGINVEVE